MNLTERRRIDPDRRDEILLLEGFAKVHGLAPGNRLSAVINGARRSFPVAGFAQAPEFL